MGSDFPIRGLPLILAISIHAPRMGSDIKNFDNTVISTNFNPRSPHGERLSPFFGSDNALLISIHAPRMGSDAIKAVMRTCEFIISIHAPRMGSDSSE